MIYEASPIAIALFAVFVGITLGLSFYLGRQAKSSQGYFAAHGTIPWFVNGVAFAGDYLSAASFLGICGMIAFYGYDGFLYSIGYLAGWIVALFVIAEPMKRLGKFTFADALDARFHSPGIKLAAGISTLVVSIFYLIPQMVGAGALVQPLLGFPHWVGVVLVGAVVTYIVVTAGMVSTTWVQFLKGSLLVIFSAVLVALILGRGLTVKTDHGGGEPVTLLGTSDQTKLPNAIALEGDWAKMEFVRSREPEGILMTWLPVGVDGDHITYYPCQTVTTKDGLTLINGLPKGAGEGQLLLSPVGSVYRLPNGQSQTGPLTLWTFLSTLQQSEVVLWGNKTISEPDGGKTVVYFPKITPGSKILRPGENPTFQGIRSNKLTDKLNFLSLMLALFCGTASLPHILIRYYTVKDAAAARKSTIVGIACIGFFYILTLYIGLGAMTSGALDVTDSNMAAPLLARSISEWLFAVISAIAFTTVLGTVSGLILASAGAVTHDIITHYLQIKLTDHEKVRVAKVSSVFVGAIAIVLGILFKSLNVSYLVGWAFSVAASANLPALVMLLFWKGVTKQGVIAAVVVGMVSSLGWILVSTDTVTKVYGLTADYALVPFSQPGIVTIPLGFATLILVSLLTGGKQAARE